MTKSHASTIESKRPVFSGLAGVDLLFLFSVGLIALAILVSVVL